MTENAVGKILIYHEGETLRTGLANLPFIRALRYHFGRSEICWLTRHASVYRQPIFAPLVTGFLDRIDNLAENPITPMDLVMPNWHSEKFDLVMDSGAAKILGWSLSHWLTKNGRYINRKNIARADAISHPVGKLLAMLQHAIGGAIPETRLRFHYQPEIEEMAARILRPGYHYLVLAPGGSVGTRWPLEHYIAVAQGVSANNQVPVFLLGPEEEIWQARLLALVPNALFPLQHPYARSYHYRFDLTIAMLERCHMGLASDNLAAELIAAADLPLLSLFGPTDPTQTAPWTKKGLVLEAKLFGGTDMHRIPPVNVLHALAQQAKQFAAKS